jgi:hypothetical protein
LPDPTPRAEFFVDTQGGIPHDSNKKKITVGKFESEEVEHHDR